MTQTPNGRNRASSCGWTPLISFLFISQLAGLTMMGTVDAFVATPRPHRSLKTVRLEPRSVKVLSSIVTNGEEESTAIEKSSSRALFPYLIEDIESKQRGVRDRPFKAMVVRHLEDDDLPEVVRMCVKEFGPSNPQNNPLVRMRRVLDYAMQILPLPGDANLPALSTSSKNSNSDIAAIPELAEYILNYAMAWILYLGLVSRVRWRMWGEEKRKKNPELQPDHHVLCLADQESNQIIGIAEVSYQLPYQTAPAYVLPMSLKKILSRFVYSFNLSTEHDESSMDDALLVMPYVSSVVVKDVYRGFGYGSVLMRAVERHAKDFLKCDQITLHVDANKETTEAAQSLYFRMGYRPISDDRKSILVAWFADYENTKTGTYFCDGTQMLYMKKRLCD